MAGYSTASALPFRNKASTTAGRWTFRDITLQKRTEQILRENEKQLRELSHELEDRVLQRTQELQEQTQRLRELAGDLASAEHRERKRLAALLHDDLQQLLAAASMRLNAVSSRLPESRDKEEIAQAATWIGNATTAARELTHELRPPALYEGGLVPALAWLAERMQKRHNLAVVVKSEGEPVPLQDDCNALLFACVRELLFNVVKHAGVDEASVSVVYGPSLLQISVEDRGKGVDPAARTKRNNGDSFGFVQHSRAHGRIRRRHEHPVGGRMRDALRSFSSLIRTNLQKTDRARSGRRRPTRSAARTRQRDKKGAGARAGGR